MGRALNGNRVQLCVLIREPQLPGLKPGIPTRGLRFCQDPSNGSIKLVLETLETHQLTNWSIKLVLKTLKSRQLTNGSIKMALKTLHNRQLIHSSHHTTPTTQTI